MIIGDNWEQYQKVKADDGYWSSWSDAIANFWDLASRACAEAATGDVYVYMTQQVSEDQTR